VNKLYNGIYEEALEIIFSLLDINNDGIIELDNIRMMLSYLTLKIHKYNIEYKYQMKSLDENDEI
jgi:Ca2+-binding EF-hand superfamily protein